MCVWGGECVWRKEALVRAKRKNMVFLEEKPEEGRKAVELLVRLVRSMGGPDRPRGKAQLMTWLAGWKEMNLGDVATRILSHA